MLIKKKAVFIFLYLVQTNIQKWNKKFIRLKLVIMKKQNVNPKNITYKIFLIIFGLLSEKNGFYFL